MTGKLYQMACIVASAKRALREHAGINDTPASYVQKIQFRFLPEGEAAEVPVVDGVPDWYQRCVRRGLQNVKFFLPMPGGERGMRGFSVLSRPAIVCLYENYGTYFTAAWNYDRSLQVWNVLYTEYLWPEGWAGMPRFSNHKEGFLKVLSEIQGLALKLECNYFAKTFRDAQDILLGSKDYEEKRERLPSIPEEDKLALFAAADTACVFGGMGSWNDSPEFIAAEKGLGAEYDRLSSELRKNIDLAVLYAINEW